MKTLQAWLDWQLSQYPSEIDLGLTRVATVWKRLYPLPFPSQIISIAGTNGKGSTVAILEAILQQMEWQVGAYTSPHLLHYNERIKINGIAVDDRVICDAFEQIKTACKADIKLTYFEYATLAALLIFAQAKLEVVILEVGLGGRLDAVNIMDADIAIITSIDIDHQSWLGETREAIGYQKSGIFRANKAAIYGGLNPPLSVIKYAKQLKSHLFLAQQDYQFLIHSSDWTWQHKNQSLQLPFPLLKGEKQIQNAGAAICALAQLTDLNQNAIQKGLQQIKIEGRFQTIDMPVPLILDVGHNPQAAKTLAMNLKNNPIQGKRIAIFSILADKEIKTVCQIMTPYIDQWLVTGLTVERGLSAHNLVKKMPSMLNIIEYQNIKTALKQAFNMTNKGDQIIVFGSFYLVSKIIELMIEKGHITQNKVKK